MKTKGKYVYTFRLSIGFDNADQIKSFSIEKWVEGEDEWDALTEKEREAIIEGELDKWSYQFIESTYK